jgi:hypothetical protein
MKGVVDRLFARQNPGAMLADMRPAAGGCEIRTAPRLCLARLRDLRAYLDAVLGSNDGDSPLTDGADHGSELADSQICSKSRRAYDRSRTNAAGRWWRV